jgi:hypothetical protein
MGQRAKPNRRNLALRVVLLLLLALLAGTAGWCRWVYAQIESLRRPGPGCPGRSLLTPSPSLARPSTTAGPPPVYRARLDHALRALPPRHRPAHHHPGGAAAATSTTRAPWAASTWMGMGVSGSRPSSPRPKAAAPSESARRIAVIARANGLRRLVIVSDGTHLFRIHAICAAERPRRV